MSRCPQCNFGRAWKLGDGRKKCRSCGARYTPKKSIWNSYRITESTKKKLVEYFVLGVPVFRARHLLPCSRRTAERFFRDIRMVLAQHEELREPLEGELEIDESAFGGKQEGKRGWGAYGKVLVLGIYKRNGKVRTSIVPNRRQDTLLSEIAQHTKPGSLYFTDEYRGYGKLSLRGGHVVIRKTKGKPKGRDTINGIEGFWSYAKTWLSNYRRVPKKYFHLYLGEISFRYNYRNEDLTVAITHFLKKRKNRTKFSPVLLRIT